MTTESKTQAKYVVIDRHTGTIVSKPMSRISASRSVDRRDNAYGAYRYGYKLVVESEV